MIEPKNETTKRILFGLGGVGLVAMIGFGIHEINRANDRAEKLGHAVEMQQGEIGNLHDTVATLQDDNRKLNDTVQTQELVIQGQEGVIQAYKAQALTPVVSLPELVPVVHTNAASSTACSVLGAVAGVGGTAAGGIAGASAGSAVPVVGTAIGGTLGAAAGGAAARGATTWMCNSVLAHFPL